MSAHLRALLATARIANVPSVACNVLTGMLLVWFFDSLSPGWNDNTILTMISACCLYVAGNFLNDWYDVEWDRVNRPERAIPSGLFKRDQYLGIALALTLLGALMSWVVNLTVFAVYGVIALLVVCYTLVHKKQAYSIWIMGACRAGLYAMGIAAMSSGFGVVRDFLTHWQEWQGLLLCALLLVPLLGMLTYIAGISLLARYESRALEDRAPKFIAGFLLLMPLLTHACLWGASHSFGAAITRSWIGVVGLIPFALWTLSIIFVKQSVAVKVGRLLAGIALVDSVYWWSSGTELYQFFGAPSLTFLSIPLLAFLASILLQKIAPAT